MSKSLKTLIRLEKRKIDEIRREMVEVERERDALEAVSEKLRAKLEEEIKLAEALVSMGNFFGDFAEHIKKQRQVLAQQIQLLERKIGALRDKLSDAFSEQKKYEIALEARQREAKEKAERIEQQGFDEIAGQRFRRARGGAE